MSRRKKKARPSAEKPRGVAPTAAPPEAGPASEVLRRVLLTLVTLQVVLRPLVLGEDAALLDPQSDQANLILTLCWLLIGVGWAGWRFWSGRGGLGLVEGGLFACVGAVGLSAGLAAGYRHAALLVAWEWLALLAAFVAVRQLVRTPAENQALLAALLAAGVSVASHAVHQGAVELPALRAQLGDHESLRRQLQANGIDLEADDPYVERLRRRIEEAHAFGTYAHPNSFAGYLALLLPPLVGCAIACRRNHGTGWQTRLAWVAAAWVGLALWFTHSQGAFLALALVGVVLWAWAWRGRLAAHRGKVALVVLTAAALVAVAVQVGATRAATGKDAGRSVRVRLDYWSASWAMWRDHLWLGVGPGNFDRHYPRYMAEAAWEKVKDPHNFVLEMGTTTGIVGLVVLLATLALMARAVYRAYCPGAPCGPEPTAEPWRVPWECYLGAMAAMLLGLMLRSAGLTQAEILMEGVYAAMRSVFWFGAFAVLSSISSSGPGKVVALLGGVAALLINLLVSGGLTQPSVAQPLWVMAALALNALPTAHVDRPARHWLSAAVPLPLAVAALFAYVNTIFVPITDGAGHVRTARQGAGGVLRRRDVIEVSRVCRPLLTGLGATPSSGLGGPALVAPTLAFYERNIELLVLEAKSLLIKNVLQALVAATEADPGNAVIRAELIGWYIELWKLDPEARSSRYKGYPDQAAFTQAEILLKKDPHGKEVHLLRHRLFSTMARRVEKDRRYLFNLAAEAMGEVVQRDPTEARWHWSLAEAYMAAEKPTAGRLAAAEALRLDEVSTELGRRLKDGQREQARAWVAGR